jgi:hypothetical protein
LPVVEDQRPEAKRIQFHFAPVPILDVILTLSRKSARIDIARAVDKYLSSADVHETETVFGYEI